MFGLMTGIIAICAFLRIGMIEMSDCELSKIIDPIDVLNDAASDNCRYVYKHGNVFVEYCVNASATEYINYMTNLDSDGDGQMYDLPGMEYIKIDYEQSKMYDACFGNLCRDEYLFSDVALPSFIVGPFGRRYAKHADGDEHIVLKKRKPGKHPELTNYRSYRFPDWNKMAFAKTIFDRSEKTQLSMHQMNNDGIKRIAAREDKKLHEDRLPGVSYDYDPMGEYDFEFVRKWYYLHTLSPKYTLELPDYTDIDDDSYAVVSRKFWVSPHLVTQSEFRAAMGFNPSYFISCGRKCPAENVTWFQALAYANERSKAEGLETCYELRGCDRRYASCVDVAFKGLDCRGYRIPTDEEWRYVAKRLNRKDYAGMSRYDAKSFRKPVSYFGCVRRRYRFQSYFAHMSEKRDECYGTFPVATHSPDSLGLYDFNGNANIWVWDWYGYASRSGDSLGPEYGFCRIVRGGNFLTGKSLARYCYPPNKGGSAIGIRLVKTADGYNGDGEEIE